jgi:hypothetical protein
MGYITGKYKDDVHDGGHDLHDSYRDMAVANGVDPDDPALGRCRYHAKRQSWIPTSPPLTAATLSASMSP